MRKYGTEWIVQIDDVTPFVQKQHKLLQKSGHDDLWVARERVYPLLNQSIGPRIELDYYEHPQGGVTKSEHPASTSQQSSHENCNDDDEQTAQVITNDTTLDRFQFDQE